MAQRQRSVQSVSALQRQFQSQFVAEHQEEYDDLKHRRERIRAQKKALAQAAATTTTAAPKPTGPRAPDPGRRRGSGSQGTAASAAPPANSNPRRRPSKLARNRSSTKRDPAVGHNPDLDDAPVQLVDGPVRNPRETSFTTMVSRRPMNKPNLRYKNHHLTPLAGAQQDDTNLERNTSAPPHWRPPTDPVRDIHSAGKHPVLAPIAPKSDKKPQAQLATQDRKAAAAAPPKASAPSRKATTPPKASAPSPKAAAAPKASAPSPKVAAPPTEAAAPGRRRPHVKASSSTGSATSVDPSPPPPSQESVAAAQDLEQALEAHEQLKKAQRDTASAEAEHVEAARRKKMAAMAKKRQQEAEASSDHVEREKRAEERRQRLREREAKREQQRIERQQQQGDDGDNADDAVPAPVRAASPPLPTHRPAVQSVAPPAEQSDPTPAPPVNPPAEVVPAVDEPAMPSATYQVPEPATIETEDGTILTLMPCPTCGRSFAADRLAKHQKVCRQNQDSKRKAFDVKKQRLQAMGSEAIAFAKNAERTEKKYQKKNEVRKNNWKRKHQDFVAAIRAAKTGDTAPPAMEDPSLVKCQHCGRTFNEDAAERHIPICKRKADEQRMKKGPASRRKK